MSSCLLDRGPIRVLLVDSTKMACQLLADAISQDPNVQVVAAVTHAVEACHIVSDMSPNIALLGGGLDGRSTGGFELARQLRLIEPELFVVMLLDRLHGESVVEAFRACANGVFIRDGSVESLLKCIYRVSSGQIWASSDALHFVLGALAGTSMPTVDPDSMTLLTRREREVFGLAADGLTNREISKKLGISDHTVKNYLFSIFGKLGVGSRLELIRAVKQESVRRAKVSRSNESLDWLRALADQGFASAQLLLAQIYCEGRGVPQDRTQAYRWFLLAEKSAQIMEISRSSRKKLAARMSPMEIAEAERQAAMWLEDNRKQLTKPLSA
jgi:two-component system, NarL family, nitrate/nitrite response regulator NarL